MRILVCIKQVPDTSSQITIDESCQWIDESKASFRMNRYDEHALEEALRIKDHLAGTEVHALTTGPARASAVIRRALETGADEGFHIILPAGFMEPAVTASLIVEHVKRNGYDLVLCGQMTEDGMSGQTGPVAASMLDLPFSTSVVSIRISPEDNAAIIERDMGGAERQSLKISLPCLLTVQSGINTPRYPSLSNVLRAKKQPIHTVETAMPKTLTPFSIALPGRSAAGTFLEGSIPQKAGALVRILHERSII